MPPISADDFLDGPAPAAPAAAAAPSADAFLDADSFLDSPAPAAAARAAAPAAAPAAEKGLLDRAVDWLKGGDDKSVMDGYKAPAGKGDSVKVDGFGVPLQSGYVREVADQVRAGQPVDQGGAAGAIQEQVRARDAQMKRLAKTKLEKQFIPERSMGEAAADTVTAVRQGVNSVTGTIPGAVKGLVTGDMNNATLKAGKAEEKRLNAQMSQSFQMQEQAAKDAIDGADGIAGKMGAAFTEYLTNPALFTTELAKQLPNFAVMGAVGRLTAATTGLLGAGLGASAKVIDRAAGAAGTAAAVGTGGVMQGADVAEGVYSDLVDPKKISNELWRQQPAVQQLMAEGQSFDQAKQTIALGLTRKAAVASGLLSLGVNLLPGAAGFERALVGAASKKGAAGGLIGRMVLPTVMEPGTEAIEEGGGAAFGNLAKRQVNPNQDLSEGVGQAMGQAAAVSIGPGMVGGVADVRGAIKSPAPAVPPVAPGTVVTPADSAVARAGITPIVVPSVLPRVAGAPTDAERIAGLTGETVPNSSHQSSTTVSPVVGQTPTQAPAQTPTPAPASANTSAPGATIAAAADREAARRDELVTKQYIDGQALTPQETAELDFLLERERNREAKADTQYATELDRQAANRAHAEAQAEKLRAVKATEKTRGAYPDADVSARLQAAAATTQDDGLGGMASAAGNQESKIVLPGAKSTSTAAPIATGKTLFDAQMAARGKKRRGELMTAAEIDLANQPLALPNEGAQLVVPESKAGNAAGVPDSAFNGDLEEGLNRVFLHQDYNGQPVPLANQGFRADEIAALEKAGMASNGAMSQEQYSAWSGERSRRNNRNSTAAPAVDNTYSTRERADSYLQRKGLAETHHVVAQGDRFAVVPKRIDASADSGMVLQNRDRNSVASIQQMNSIAADPDYGRLSVSRDFANGAPVVFSDGELPASAVRGKASYVSASDGRRIPVEYAVVEAQDLLASNKADGTPIDSYAKGEAGKLRAVAGNGRVAGLQAAYGRGTAKKYRDELAGDQDHGVDGERIARMTNPVLVRVMPKGEVTADIGDVSNTSGTAQLSPLEQAQNDARRIDLAALQFGEDGQLKPLTISQFVQSMPVAERSAMLGPDGGHTRQAEDRLMAAIFHEAYGDPELVALYAQASDPEAKAVLNALAAAAPAMVQLKDAGEFDIRAVVTEAAQGAVNARRRGEKLADYAKSRDMTRSSEGDAILQFMADNIRSSKRMGEGLQALAQGMLEAHAASATDSMFADLAPAGAGDVMNKWRTDNGQTANESGNPGNPENTGRADDAQSPAAQQADAGRGQASNEGNQGAEKQPEVSPIEQAVNDQVIPAEAAELEYDGAKPFASKTAASLFRDKHKIDAEAVEDGSGGWVLQPTNDKMPPEERKEEKARVADLNDMVRDQVGGKPVAPVFDNPTADIGLARAVAKAFGIPLTIVTNSDLYEGVMWRKRIFVSIGSNSAILAVTGHEAAHMLEGTPEHDALLQHIQQYLKAGAVEGRRQWDNNRRERDPVTGQFIGREMTTELATNEVLADLSGAMWLDPQFWQSMIEKDANLFRRVAYQFLKVASRAVSALKGSNFDASKYVDDIAAVRDLIAATWTIHLQNRDSGTQAAPAPKPAPDAQEKSDELTARAEALQPRIDALTDSQVMSVAGKLQIAPNRGMLDIDRLRAKIAEQHPDDIEAALKVAEKPPKTKLSPNELAGMVRYLNGLHPANLQSLANELGLDIGHVTDDTASKAAAVRAIVKQDYEKIRRAFMSGDATFESTELKARLAKESTGSLKSIGEQLGLEMGIVRPGRGTEAAIEQILTKDHDEIRAILDEAKQTIADREEAELEQGRADRRAREVAAAEQRAAAQPADVKKYTKAEASAEWNKLSAYRRGMTLARIGYQGTELEGKQYEEFTPAERKLIDLALNEEHFSPIWYVNKDGRQVNKTTLPEKSEGQLAQEKLDSDGEKWRQLGIMARHRLMVPLVGADADQAQYASWINIAPEYREKLSPQLDAALEASKPAPKVKAPRKPRAKKAEAGVDSMAKPAEVDQAAFDQAKLDAMAALADLGNILGKFSKKENALSPEDEAKLLPVLTRLVDATMRMGKVTFRDSVNASIGMMRQYLGDQAAAKLSLDNLQAAYINAAGRYQDKGADSKKSVINDYDTLADVLEQDHQDAFNPAGNPPATGDTDAQPDDQENVFAPDIPADEGTQQDGAGTGGGRDGQQDGAGVSDSDAPAAGAGSNNRPGGRGGRSGTSGGSSGRGNAGRRDQGGNEGVSADDGSIEQADAAVDEGAGAGKPSLADKIAAQRAAESIPVELGNAANIEATLPFLLPAQRSDVLFAETRFGRADKQPGVMFTNGTGTGKTFTGLGIMKRLHRAGKVNQIVVVPNNEIAQDWIDSAKNLGLTIKQLDGIEDSGPARSIIVTTFANFGANKTLADRDFDAVFVDEAHYLSANEAGDVTDALRTLQALTRHPNGFSQYQWMRLRGLNDKLAAIPENDKAARQPIQEEIGRRQEQLRVEYEAVANSPLDRPKAIMLSATPFAYVKNVDYANGYLYTYGDESGSGYNSGNGRERFFMQHFGYRMRYNKLTAPDGKVDQGLMARQFNTWLKQEGALSGRMLEVDADYDRKFVMVPSALGSKIDEGLEHLQANKEYAPLLEQIRKRFDYLSRRYLLEAIKATEALPHIREHLAKGRKVVIVHDYKKGGAFNPFGIHGLNGTEYVYDEATGQQKPVDIAQLAQQFASERPDLQRLDIPRASALDTLLRAFPDALVHNGSVPKKQLQQNKKLFNDDSKNHDIIILQSDKGREGISLHDTSGKKQRVMVNIGQPAKPTALIQLEGRIYRTGQVSNAVMRYLNTGTNWERWTFADTIAGRADTAEALAMGELARGLRESIIEAFEESDNHPVSDEDGKGGKARDRNSAKLISAWDRAKSFYFGQAKKNSRTKAAEGKDYFATPEPIGLKMAEFADILIGEDVLEPSAGHGAIARWLPGLASKTIIEPSTELMTRTKLVIEGDARFEQTFFENHHIANKYHAIVMNPPYGLGGSVAIPHLAKAAKHLRDGGRIVALLPRGPAADKKLEKFLESDEAKGLYTVADMQMPGVTFERAGTGVMTHILVLEKQSDPDKAPYPIHYDFTDAEDINALFDRMKDVALPGRAHAVSPLDVALEEETKPAKPKGNKTTPGERLAAAITDKATTTDSSGLFTSTEFKHSKTGETMYQVAANDRVGTDQYKTLLAIAKKNGGWYSKFNGGGAVRGFLFKTSAERLSFMREAAESDAFDDQAPQFSRKDQTETPAFKAWFGDWQDPKAFSSRAKGPVSHAVDRAGKPLVLYHATNASFDSFRVGVPTINATTFGDMETERHGIFTTPDVAFAETYLKKGDGQNVMPLYMSIQAPMDMRDGISGEQIADIVGNSDGKIIGNDFRYLGNTELWQLFDGDFGKNFVAAAKRAGYDGAIIQEEKPDTDTNHDVYVAFDAGQVKSATGNNGAFDGSNSDARFARKAQPGQGGLDFDAMPAEEEAPVDLKPGQVFHDGEVWNVLGKGAERDGKVFAHLASTTRFREQRNGRVPAQINDWVPLEAFGDEPAPKAFMETALEANRPLSKQEILQRQLDNQRAAAREAAQAAAPAAPARRVTADQVDMFNTQGGLFSKREELPMRRRDITDSIAFQAWFGNSAVVDEFGQPLVVYHGTTGDFSTFQPETGWMTVAPSEANMYGGKNGEGANVMPAYVKIENPRIIDGDETSNWRSAIYDALTDGSIDGVIVTKEGQPHWVVPVESSQIKSATGNNGGFDPSNPDIRFSKKQGQRFSLPDETSLGDRENFGKQKQQRFGQDYFGRVKAVIKAVREQGGNVTEANDPYLAEERMPGRVRAAVEDLHNQALQPFVDHVAKAGLELDEVATYLYALHAPERNRYIASINRRFPDGGSGMKDADAAAVIARAAAEGKTAALDQAAAMLHGITEATRLMQLDQGLITQEQFDAWSSQYDNYVPLRGFEGADEAGTAMPSGRGFNIRGDESLRAMGRRSRAADLIENIFGDYERAVSRSERNNVGKAVYDFIRANPDPDLWQIDATEIRQRMDRVTGMVRQVALVDKGPDTIGVKIAGHNVYIKFKDPLMARAFRMAGKDESGEVEQFLGKTFGQVNSLLRAAYTKYNPLFIPVNAIRDVGTGTFGMIQEQGFLRSAAFLKNYPLALAVAFRGVANVGARSRQVDRLYDEYRHAGGITGGYFRKDPKEMRADLRAALVRAGAAPHGIGERLKGNAAYRAAAAMFRAVEILGETTENATRFAAYMTAREGGTSIAKSASIAKNLTTNFDRRGEWGSGLSSLYLFYNAGVQGTARFYQAIKSPKVQAVMAGMTAFTAMVALMNGGAGDDDDGQAWWDKIATEEKERNFILMLPEGVHVPGEKQVGKFGRYVKVPMPYGFNVFAVAGYALSDAYRHSMDPKRGRPIGQSVASVASALVGSFNPINGGIQLLDKDNKPMASQVLQQGTPTALMVLTQLATNKDWRGRDVAPAYRDEVKPRSERYFLSQTGSASQRITEWLNGHTGGNRAKPGAVDIAPAQLDLVIKSYTGGIGTIIRNAVNTAAQVQAGEPVDSKNIPLVSRFYGLVDDPIDQRLYYERATEGLEAYKRLLNALKMGIAPDVDPASKAMQVMGAAATGYQEAFQKMRQAESAIINSRTLSDDEKTASRTKLAQARAQLVDSFNKIYMEKVPTAQ